MLSCVHAFTRSRVHADRIPRAVSKPSATLAAATATFPSANLSGTSLLHSRPRRPTDRQTELIATTPYLCICFLRENPRAVLSSYRRKASTRQSAECTIRLLARADSCDISTAKRSSPDSSPTMSFLPSFRSLPLTTRLPRAGSSANTPLASSGVRSLSSTSLRLRAPVPSSPLTPPRSAGSHGSAASGALGSGSGSSSSAKRPTPTMVWYREIVPGT